MHAMARPVISPAGAGALSSSCLPEPRNGTTSWRMCMYRKQSLNCRFARASNSFLTGTHKLNKFAPREHCLTQKHKQLLTKRVAGTRALFTGIVEEMGTVKELKEVDGSWELLVEADVVLEDVKLGDSIAVNGTCLTVTEFDKRQFKVGLAPETLRKTSLEELEQGSKVNLERSLQPSGRMGGHFVQGHVDGTGVITKFAPEGDSVWVTVKTTPQLLRYIVPKGYIAVDGTSLTVVDVLDQETSFTFMLVAYTQQKIVVPLKKVGDKVNLEVDIVGKYVERMLAGYQSSPREGHKPASDVYNPVANVQKSSSESQGEDDRSVVLTAGLPPRADKAGPSGYGAI